MPWLTRSLGAVLKLHEASGPDHSVGPLIAFWSSPWLAAVAGEALVVSQRMPRSQQTSSEVSARKIAPLRLSHLHA
jgi:hypothetical protein